jgi:NADH-quinone oxidoreductase subunit N
MTNFQITKITDLHLFEEAFVGVSLLYLITYGSFISFSSRYNYTLFSRSFLNLVILVLVLGTYLSIKGDKPCLIESTNFSEAVSINFLSYATKNTITFFSILSLILIKEYIRINKINDFEYLILMLFAILGLILLCASNDLITMFLALELQGLAFYVLAAIKKQSSYSVESGLKYFVVGSFASGIFLFGVSLIYSILGTINFNEISQLKLSDIVHTNKYGVYLILEDNPAFYFSHDLLIQNRLIHYANIGFLFILMSLFIKVSLAPFHLWSPDVYENSPTSSSFFFIILPKLSLIFALIKLSYYCCFGSFTWLKELLSILVLLSISLGALGGFEQRKIKSLLTYSSVSHLGFLVLSLISESFEGIISVYSYLITYVSSGICLWGILVLLKMKDTKNEKLNKDLSDMALLIKSNKALCLILAGILFSLAGLPPLVGFLVKLNVLLITTQNSYYLVASLSLFFSMVSLFYYIRIIKIICFEKLLVGKLYEPINSKSIVIPITLFYVILFLFGNPSLFYKLIYRTCVFMC